MHDNFTNLYTTLLTWVEDIETSPYIIKSFQGILSRDQHQGVVKTIGHINLVQGLIPQVYAIIHYRNAGGNYRTVIICTEKVDGGIL